MTEITTSKKDEDVLEWPKVRVVIFMSSLIFFCTTFIFMSATSDIKDYVSDHRMINYDFIEFIIIVIFIIVFYVISKLCHPHIKSRLPSKIAKCKCIYLIPSIAFSILAIIGLSYIVFPWIVGDINTPELVGLRRTVFIWLFSILIINIMLDQSPFEKPLTEEIEKGWIGLKSIFKQLKD
jgi:hypothetical protein